MDKIKLIFIGASIILMFTSCGGDSVVNTTKEKPYVIPSDIDLEKVLIAYYEKKYVDRLWYHTFQKKRKLSDGKVLVSGY